MTASRPTTRTLVLLALLGSGAAAAWAQDTSNYIFQCTTGQGRKLTSDRLIGECNDREQKVYSRSGVLIRTVPPSLTAEERAVVDARLEKERAVQEAKAEDLRRDRQLLLRFPSERSHLRAREASLDPATSATRVTEVRLKNLAEERKPLDQEAEFYVGKPLPFKLKQQFDAIEATEQALKTALKAQAEERARVNDMYDIELERLKKLWAGAFPGTLGPLRSPTAVASEAGAQVGPDTASSTSSPQPARPGGGGGGSGMSTSESPVRVMSSRQLSDAATKPAR